MLSGLGISLFLAGLALVVIVLAWLTLRMLPRTTSASLSQPNSPEFPESTNQKKRSLSSSLAGAWII